MSEIKEIMLTDEMKLALKNTLGFNVDDTFNYVPEAFRTKDKDGNYIIPKELWTIYKLRSKDGIESAEVEDNAGYMTYDSQTKESKMHIQSGKSRIENLKTGIVEINNFHFENGDRMSFNAKMKTMTIKKAGGGESVKNGADVRSVIRFMRPEIQLEISNAINERKILTPEEQQGL